jgi:putative ABC transport system substrate-binding protein
MRSRLPRILLVLVAGILLMPLDGSAQTSAKVYRIGVLETSPPDLRSPSQMAFYDELRQRGYVEGQNLIVERRNANRQTDQLPALARSSSRFDLTLIVASGRNLTGPPRMLRRRSRS